MSFGLHARTRSTGPKTELAAEEEIKAKEEDTALQKAMSKKATAAAKKDAAKVPRPPYPLFVCNVIY